MTTTFVVVNSGCAKIVFACGLAAHITLIFPHRFIAQFLFQQQEQLRQCYDRTQQNNTCITHVGRCNYVNATKINAQIFLVRAHSLAINLLTVNYPKESSFDVITLYGDK